MRFYLAARPFMANDKCLHGILAPVQIALFLAWWLGWNEIQNYILID